MGNTCIKDDTKNEVYSRQPDEHYRQLNTESDQKGKTSVCAILKDSRNVLGQPAADMLANPVDWSEYGLSFSDIKRPSPEDFPAFERKDGNKKLASVEVSCSSTNSKPDPKIRSKNPKEYAPAGADDQLSFVTKSSLTPAKQNSKSGDPQSKESKDNSKDKSKDKEKEKEKSKDKEKSKEKEKEKAPKTDKPITTENQTKRVSHNVEMDQCSLEEEP